jgi:hypothetical protein
MRRRVSERVLRTPRQSRCLTSRTRGHNVPPANRFTVGFITIIAEGERRTSGYLLRLGGA